MTKRKWVRNKPFRYETIGWICKDCRQIVLLKDLRRLMGNKDYKHKCLCGHAYHEYRNKTYSFSEKAEQLQTRIDLKHITPRG